MAQSPNAGQPGVSCCNASNSCINGPPINAVCDQGDNCLDSFLGGDLQLQPRVFTYPSKMLFMTYQVATTAMTKGMTAWIVFLDFLIQGGDL